MSAEKQFVEWLAWRVIDVCQNRQHPSTGFVIKNAVQNVKIAPGQVRGSLETERTRAAVAIVAAVLVGLGWPT